MCQIVQAMYHFAEMHHTRVFPLSLGWISYLQSSKGIRNYSFTIIPNNIIVEAKICLPGFKIMKWSVISNIGWGLSDPLLYYQIVKESSPKPKIS